MRERWMWLAACVWVAVLGAAVGAAWAQSNVGQPTRLVRWEEAQSSLHDWGEFKTFFTGETYATKDVFVAMAVVKPGQAVHAAHQHAEEEYLVLVKGKGRWHLDGKDIPAKEGDVIYIEPWVMHGLLNTSEEDLTFLVVKYNGKNTPIPEKP